MKAPKLQPVPAIRATTARAAVQLVDVASMGVLPRTVIPVDWFDQPQGLQSGQVHQSAVDGQGNVWAATPFGLARFDGVRISIFGRADGLSHGNGIRAVASGNDGLFWVGSAAGLDIYTISENRFSALGSHAIGMVDCIALGADEAWIGTPKGLFHWTSKSGMMEVLEPRIAASIVADCVMTEDGAIWVVGPEFGLARFNGKTWRFFEEDLYRASGRLSCLAVGPDHTIVVGGETGLSRVGQDGREVGQISTGKPVSAIICADGLIWAGVGNALIRFKQSRDGIRPIDEVLSGVRIVHAQLDAQGNIWASTDNQGVARISCLRHAFGYHGSEVGAVLCLMKSDDGFWHGGTNGLMSPDGVHTLQGVKVWDVLRDADGSIWAATEDGLYCAVNPALPLHYNHQSPIVAQQCRCLLRAHNGLFVGSVRGLVVLTPQGADEILKPDGGSLGYVYSIFEDRDGDLWISTIGSGLWRMPGARPDEMALVSNDRLLPSHNVTSVCQAPNGDIFVAHDTYISRIGPDLVVHPFTEVQVGVSAWALFVPDDKILLAGTSTGLKEYDLESGGLNRVIVAGGKSNLSEFTSSRSLSKTANGQYYCGTGSGLRSVNLGNLDRLATAPDVGLSKVMWSGTQSYEKAGMTLVDSGKWRVEFELRTGWFVDEGSCKMRHRLLGFSTDWSAYEPLSNISYSSLPPGSYTLEVQVNSPLFGSGQSRLLYNFRVRGFWKSLANGILERLGGSDVIARVRTIPLRTSRKNRQLEQMIRERTVELKTLNDQLNISYSELEVVARTDALTGLANRRAFDEALAKETSRCRDQNLPMSVLLIDVDHFKHYNDTYGHAQGDICLSKVAAALSVELRKPDDLVSRIGGEEFAILLPNVALPKAGVIAERLIHSIVALDIAHASSLVKPVITVSIGVATMKDETSDELMAAADVELYKAKHRGRNQWAIRT